MFSYTDRLIFKTKFSGWADVFQMPHQHKYVDVGRHWHKSDNLNIFSMRSRTNARQQLDKSKNIIKMGQAYDQTNQVYLIYYSRPDNYIIFKC
jgi:hypothetical protein